MADRSFRDECCACIPKGRKRREQDRAEASIPKQLAKTNSDGTVEEVDLIHELFTDIAPRYVDCAKQNKGGGYTRIIKVNHRAATTHLCH